MWEGVCEWHCNGWNQPYCYMGPFNDKASWSLKIYIGKVCSKQNLKRVYHPCLKLLGGWKGSVGGSACVRHVWVNSLSGKTF